MVVVKFDMEASQTRGYWIAKNAILGAACPDSSLRKERLFGMTIVIALHDSCVTRRSDIFNDAPSCPRTFKLAAFWSAVAFKAWDFAGLWSVRRTSSASRDGYA